MCLPKSFSLALILGVVLMVAHPASAQADTQKTLDVRLFSQHQPTRVTVTGVESPLLIFAGDYGQPLRRVTAGTPVTVAWQREQLFLETNDGGIYALSLRVAPAASGKTMRIAVSDGPEPRTYLGSLTLQANGDASSIRLVNTVELEPYVACVLGGEYGLDDVEGTKAMAVAIRTYALHPRDEAGGEADLADTRLSQVYRGAAYANERNLQAARATRGEVLTYGGQMIDATYSSSSGGFTANNEDVWDGPERPYLRAQADPYDTVSPYQHWREEIDRSDVLDLLSGAVSGEATGFVVAHRSSGGRVTSIDVLRRHREPHEMSAADFRTLVNRRLGALTLKSTFFEARRAGNVYVFEGKGFGHGVGLSQWGAHGMAKQGHTYREILSFYYPGTEVVDVEDVAPAPLVAGHGLPDRAPSVRAQEASESTEPTPPAQTTSDDRAPTTETAERAPEATDVPVAGRDADATRSIEQAARELRADVDDQHATQDDRVQKTWTSAGSMAETTSTEGRVGW